MPVISVSTPPFSPPAPNLKVGCGDLSGLDKLNGLGKFDRDALFKSLITLVMSQIPGPVSKIINNETLLPHELAGMGGLMGAASLLMDPASATQNLQGLWGRVSSAAHDEYKAVSAGLGDDLAAFSRALAKMPRAVMSATQAEQIKAAATLMKAEGSGTNVALQRQIQASCLSMGSGSQLIFAAYDASLALKGLVSDLEAPLGASGRVLGAAGNVLATVETLARNGLDQQLAEAGVSGLKYDLDLISAIANLPSSAFNPCGPQALQAMAVMRQVCQTSDNFLSTAGFGSVDWSILTGSLRDALISGPLRVQADAAAGYSEINSAQLISNIDRVVDDFLSHAMCAGGSDNLGNAMLDKFGDEIGKGLTAAATVATLYGSAAAMTQTFQNVVALMEHLGSAGAINQLISGDMGSALSSLFSGKIQNPKIAALKALRDCLQKNGGDPQKLAIVDAQLRAEESTANSRWPMAMGWGDATGFFTKAQSIEKSRNQIRDNILNNTAISLNTP